VEIAVVDISVAASAKTAFVRVMICLVGFMAYLSSFLFSDFLKGCWCFSTLSLIKVSQLLVSVVTENLSSLVFSVYRKSLENSGGLT
jgi:hypothetical protein